MLKFLIILILISYLLYKVGGFLWKIFFIGASNAQQQTTQGRRKAHNSDLNIDYAPPEGPVKKPQGYDGGDYIDYEEVDK